ncbi:MAG: hypothetical protein H6Q84_2657, partial [Deltaproteobacteria bacterium]|nr:hypothetical protein [Deltaproteobacteria bacterium]
MKKSIRKFLPLAVATLSLFAVSVPAEAVAADL